MARFSPRSQTRASGHKIQVHAACQTRKTRHPGSQRLAKSFVSQEKTEKLRPRQPLEVAVLRL